MLETKVKINERQVKSISDRMQKAGEKVTSKKILDVIATKIKLRILTRTDKGLDVNNRSFKPYTAEYALEKGKTQVNLRDTGLMLGSMFSKVVSEQLAKINFPPGDRFSGKAQVHNEGLDGMPQREFFGVNNKDENFALDLYQQEVREQLRKLNLT